MENWKNKICQNAPTVLSRELTKKYHMERHVAFVHERKMPEVSIKVLKNNDLVIYEDLSKIVACIQDPMILWGNDFCWFEISAYLLVESKNFRMIGNFVFTEIGQKFSLLCKRPETTFYQFC